MVSLSEFFKKLKPKKRVQTTKQEVTSKEKPSPGVKAKKKAPEFKLPKPIEDKIQAWSKPISRKFPKLKGQLEQANMKIPVEQFVAKTMKNSLMLSIGLIIIAAIALQIVHLIWLIILVIPAAPVVSFLYLLKLPILNTKKVQRDIDQEIIYASRFLLIELTAGVPLYDALNNTANNFKKVGKYFGSVTKKIETGTPTELALDEVIETTPSENLRKVLWQINNSLRTGSDVNTALTAITEQISREQLIQVEEYARKLNPLVMFYLMLAVILPSLGITMLALLSTFIQLNLSLGLLIGLAIVIGIIQFGFFSTIKSARPGIEV